MEELDNLSQYRSGKPGWLSTQLALSNLQAVLPRPEPKVHSVFVQLNARFATTGLGHVLLGTRAQCGRLAPR